MMCMEAGRHQSRHREIDDEEESKSWHNVNVLRRSRSPTSVVLEASDDLASTRRFTITVNHETLPNRIPSIVTNGPVKLRHMTTHPYDLYSQHTTCVMYVCFQHIGDIYRNSDVIRHTPRNILTYLKIKKLLNRSLDSNRSSRLMKPKNYKLSWT